MKNVQHKILSKGGWRGKSYLEQMANIGSEVYRAISWKEKNSKYSEIAFVRSLELFDLTKQSTLTAPQYRELTRMREIWVDFYFYSNQYSSTADSINTYFRYLTVAFKNRENHQAKEE